MTTYKVVEIPHRLRAHSFVARMLAAEDQGMAILIEAHERKSMTGYYQYFSKKGFTLHMSRQPDGAVVCWLDRIDES